MRVPYQDVQAGSPDSEGMVTFSVSDAASVYEALLHGDDTTPLRKTMSANSWAIGYHWGARSEEVNGGYDPPGKLLERTILPYPGADKPPRVRWDRRWQWYPGV